MLTEHEHLKLEYYAFFYSFEAFESFFPPDDLPFPSLLSLSLLSGSSPPPNPPSMTLRVHQPCNCEQLLESELYSWLHIIFHLSVWIFKSDPNYSIAVWFRSPTTERLIDLCVYMRGLKLQRRSYWSRPV